jgi:hypothetical protein
MIDVARIFFEADGWPYQLTEQPNVLLINFQGENGQWRCVVSAREDVSQLVFYSLFPMSVPADKRGDVAEFIIRANFGLILGNFEMDLDDGQLRFKTSIDVEGDALSPALMHNLVYSNVVLMDEYMPGLMQVIFANVNAAAAIAAIENKELPGYDQSVN